MRLPFKPFNRDIPVTVPKYATEGDSGMDLYATGIEFNAQHDYIEFSTNLCVAIPMGYEGQLRMRSSVSKLPITLCNALGTIDSGYRGEIKARFRGVPGLLEEMSNAQSFTEQCYEDAINAQKGGVKSNFCYVVGDAVAQLVISPVAQTEPYFVPALSTTERGEGGFGSSGA